MREGSIAESLARLGQELSEAGAEAVVLVGSHARGESHKNSDVDIIALGTGHSRMRAFDGLLVSEQWLDPVEAGESLSDPAAVGQVVPGWRTARILHDRAGTAAALKKEAEAWCWDDLGDRPDRVVAEHVVDLCEEVLRLVGHLSAKRWMAAAFVRSVLALKCATVMAIHLRLLYETENRLWSMVAEEMGPDWTRAQEAAFGFNGEDIPTSSRAALELFQLMAATTNRVLDPGQRETVALALRALANGP